MREGRRSRSLPPCPRTPVLLGGGSQRLTRGGRRPMGSQEGAHVPYRQRNLVLGIFPRIEAHLRVRREMHRFHRDDVGVPRHVVGQDQERRLAVAHKIARHGLHEVGSQSDQQPTSTTAVKSEGGGRLAGNRSGQMSWISNHEGCGSYHGPPSGHVKIGQNIWN
jgi:hypothetical protein